MATAARTRPGAGINGTPPGTTRHADVVRDARCPVFYNAEGTAS